jgi:hypothetical protein
LTMWVSAYDWQIFDGTSKPEFPKFVPFRLDFYSS